MHASKLVLAALALAAAPVAAAPHGLTIEDMLAMERVSSPEVSPDGKWVVFVVRETDMVANKGRTDLYLASVDGRSVTHLTTSPASDSDPVWSRDGSWVYFASSRSGSQQVWRIRPNGGEAEQVTKLPLDINGFKLVPGSDSLVLTIDVYPDLKTLDATAKRDEDREKSKVKARAYDELFFRHWDQWEDGKYSHVFVWKSDRDIRDLTPGMMTDSPPHPFGGMDQIDVSPDGKWVAYVARVGGRAEAWTTNTDVYLVPLAGGRAVDLTESNKAYDNTPAFSPDGRSLALTMMKRPGFEADRSRLAIIDVASRKLRVVTEPWDHSVEDIAWSPDGRTIYTTSDNVGNHSVFSIDVASGSARLLADKGTNTDPRIAGDRIVFAKDTLTMPTELFTMKLDGSDARQLTHFNDARVKGIAWGAYEQFSFTGAKNETVHGFVVKPASYAGGKAPIAFVIHGGPQGSMGDHFHYRWNPEVFAGHGYGVVFIDFHGSTGYGQAFEDSISGDWGGAPYEDLMKGLDAAIAKYSWLDGNNAVALGASYGGYMINWIQSNTKRFKALVCHDGIFDTRAMYYETEEVWFPEWENHGTAYDKPEEYAKWNPIEFVKKAWTTPELLIHGGLDYRIPETQAMGAFTALQRRGIPSRFLEFPDENHWVLKPQNSLRWHQEVLAWIDRFTHHR
jgi:dipeptidyl aminopeptidase/acylaminoacyl peptidase